MSGHTPGPWTCLPEEMGKGYIRIRGTRLGGRYKVANVQDPNYKGIHEREILETRANARLISAAPDLLAACKRLLIEVEWEAARADIVTDEARADIALAKAAIAKAAGKS